jgi:hypothetical protein
LGTPCNSSTRARCNGKNGWSVPFRSTAFVWVAGFVQSKIHQHKVMIGSKTLAFSLALLKACRKANTSAGLENPATSMLWTVPALHNVMQWPCSQTIVVDFCSFGTKWRKIRRLLFLYLHQTLSSPGIRVTAAKVSATTHTSLTTSCRALSMGSIAPVLQSRIPTGSARQSLKVFWRSSCDLNFQHIQNLRIGTHPAHLGSNRGLF